MAEKDRRWSPYNYGVDNSIRNIDPDGMAVEENCDPCDVPSEHDITGNSQSILANVAQTAIDGVTSAVFTLASFGSTAVMPGTVPNRYSFDYSTGERTLVSTPVVSVGGAAKALGGATMDLAAVWPASGPTAAIFAKTPGVANSIETIVKDVVHANSKASTLENTLYRLETKSGEYLKTGITSKAPIEKRYSAKFLQDKKMIPLKKGSRTKMLTEERNVVKKNPGPLNKEPWAGTQAN